MKITLESTDTIGAVPGQRDVRARIWQGHTDSGIEVHAYIAAVGVARDANREQFERELQSIPHAPIAFDMRKVL